MKAIFSRDYYEKNWDRFLNEGSKNNPHYINLEADLEKAMAIYNGIGIGEEELRTIRKIEANKILEKCTKLVYSERDIIKAIENGNASLGYITEIQENHAKAELRERFEFNCLQRRVFIEKYGLQ